VRVWIIRPVNASGFEDRKAHAPKAFDNATEACAYGLKQGSFEVWKADKDASGNVSSPRKVLSYLPPQSPEYWFPSNYNKANPKDFTFVQRAQPVGVTNQVNWAVNTKLPRKPVELFRNEIEMALYESDLTASQVAYAMRLLPHIENLYAFLKQERQDKTIRLIHTIISY
jgi:hypothetical protein